jgi:hypothetical protein
MTQTRFPFRSRLPVTNIAPMDNGPVAAVTLASSYLALLTSPLSILAGNTLDRADVASVAILGYN